MSSASEQAKPATKPGDKVERRLNRAYASTSGPKLEAQLRAKLAARASSNGLLDVAYRTLESPVGELMLAATEAGLVRVAFACEERDEVLEQLAREVSPRVLAAPRRLDAAARELDEYFDGSRRRFELALDLQLAHGFRKKVIARLQEIGYGQTRSYTEVATAAGNPRAVRAVGSACARNPLPLVLPCHRVLRSDGSLGGYRGGLEAKRRLLELETP
jgi:methylated-DNA-[protein]-cysteine S-methyltransferase